jgi:hypothetical protein
MDGVIEIRPLQNAFALWFHDYGVKVTVEVIDDCLHLWHLQVPDGCEMPPISLWKQIKEEHFPDAKRLRFERVRDNVIRPVEIRIA